MSQSVIPRLHQFLLAHYNLDELKTLCVDLSVEYDDLGGEGRSGKARELVLYMQRHGRLVDLQAVLSQQHETAYRGTFGETATRPAATTAPHRQRRRFERNPRQVFVSHATADATFAHRLANDLQREGYTVWIAPESIPDGQWVSAINRGLAESGAMLLVLTPAALESPWVEMETNVAIELERAGEMRFIPVCLIKDRYDPIWHAYQWVMFNSDYGAAWRELLVRLGASPAEVIPDPVTTQKPTPANKPLPTERNISGKQAEQIKALAHDVAAELGRQSGDDELREVYRRFNRHFGLGGYRQLPRRRFEEGMAFFAAWRDEILVSPRHELVPRDSFASRIELSDREPQPPKSPATSNPRIHEKTGIELMRIPEGPFLYGRVKGERPGERPPYHGELKTLTLSEYWIGRTPVTNAQFAYFIQETRYRPTSWRKGFGWGFSSGGIWGPLKGANWRHPLGPESSIKGMNNHPVVQVSWDDAKSFCDWAGLALPSEAQWEKAARGVDGYIWPWGNEPPTLERCNLGKSFSDTTPVGHYSPQGDSPYGCADMFGNVFEWTTSNYLIRERVVRGCVNINTNPDNALTRREPGDPSQLFCSHIGFRVVELLSDPDF